MRNTIVRKPLPPDVAAAGSYLVEKALEANRRGDLDVAIELATAAATAVWSDPVLWSLAVGVLDHLLDRRGGQE